MIEVTDEMLCIVDDYKSKPRTMTDSDLVKHIIEAYEQSKPKPEPVGYIYKLRLAQMLGSKTDNYCSFFSIKDDDYRAFFNKHRDKCLALYTTPPTRKPLDIYKIPTNGTLIVDGIMLAPDCSTSFILGVRFAEQAHGIGTTNEST